MAGERVAILFDIDGTLITTGGAGAASWRLAFDELYGIPADIGQFTDAGMTDPDVGRKTFEAVLKREPERKEFAKLLERRRPTPSRHRASPCCACRAGRRRTCRAGARRPHRPYCPY